MGTISWHTVAPFADPSWDTAFDDEDLMAELTLLKVPTDPDAQYQAMFAMFRRLTQREPTLDDKNVVRLRQGLPPLTE